MHCPKILNGAFYETQMKTTCTLFVTGKPIDRLYQVQISRGEMCVLSLLAPLSARLNQTVPINQAG